MCTHKVGSAPEAHTLMLCFFILHSHLYVCLILIFGQPLSSTTMQATAGVMDFQSCDINLRLLLQYYHTPALSFVHSSLTKPQEERGRWGGEAEKEWDGGNPHPADVTYCAIIRVRGVNNISGREKESRHVAVSRGGIQRMQREEARMDEGGGALMCFTFFARMEDKCLVCKVVTAIQGNYDHVWLPKEGMWDKTLST